MEVHHHPQVEKKNFKEYFLEFIMIFLAVTLGFIAESIRERISNSEKEHHYIVSLIHDLETDTSNAALRIEDESELLAEMDTALAIPTGQLHDLDRQDTFYHHFLFFFNSEMSFHQSDNTLTQLRNAGGYSLIHAPDVSDSITALATFYEIVKSNEGFYHDDFLKVEDFAGKLIKVPYLPTGPDGNSIYPALFYHEEVFIQYDKALLEELYNLVQIERSQLDFYRLMIKRYKQKATNLITFLQKEYALK